MPKIFDVPGIGPVSIYKHRRARSLRVTIQPGGIIRVTIPSWVPYKAGVQFAVSRKDWINQHKLPANILNHGQLIGKSHRILFIKKDIDKTSTRIQGTEIRVSHPRNLDDSSTTVQAKARIATGKALKLQAEALLPRRLRDIAVRHGFQPKSVSIRNLRSRWGSCSSEGDITLNLYLMTLPWELIDYVLLHELVHTEIHNHGPDFWQRMITCDSNAKELRKLLKAHSPVL